MDKRLSLETRIGVELKSYDGTIKIYILAALFDAIEKGKASLSHMLEYKKEHEIDGSGILGSLEIGTVLSVKNLAALMIIVSDNIATNIMIDYLGVDNINACIQELGCKDTVLHNPIDFEKYEKLGTSTPRDYASMWERMAQGTLISKSASEQMLAICKQQHYNSMLTKSIPAYYLDPDNFDDGEIIYVASKSGSMNACRNDGGIFSPPYGKYVIVLFNKEFSDAINYQNVKLGIMRRNVKFLYWLYCMRCNFIADK